MFVSTRSSSNSRRNIREIYTFNWILIYKIIIIINFNLESIVLKWTIHVIAPFYFQEVFYESLLLLIPLQRLPPLLRRSYIPFFCRETLGKSLSFFRVFIYMGGGGGFFSSSSSFAPILKFGSWIKIKLYSTTSYTYP